MLKLFNLFITIIKFNYKHFPNAFQLGPDHYYIRKPEKFW
jgi:hypothetical protein